MEFEELKCLICLAQKQDWALAAQACGLSESALLLAIRAIEVEYQQPIVKPAYPFQGFTDEGERVLEHAREFCFASEEAKRSYTEAKRRSFVAPLLERRSVSPKRLCAPGPSAHDIGLIAQAGLHAPDHGSLHPWRLLEFHADQRAALADCFEAEKRRRDPLAPAKDLQHARDHALRPPPCCWPSSFPPKRAPRYRCASNGWPQALPWAACSTRRTSWALAPSC